MKYLSIDTEFTSLNLEEAQLLEIGIILEDTEKKLSYDECPKFHAIINYKTITGSPASLTINAGLLKILAGLERAENITEYRKEHDIMNDYEISGKIWEFLFLNNYPCSNPTDLINLQYVKMVGDKMLPDINQKNIPQFNLILAGKNLFSKDIPLLKKLPQWNKYMNISHRAIDPSLFFIDWKNDTEVPSLSKCKERAKVEGEVKHTSLSDAWDIISLLRTRY
jgi:hypothetical protein